ncbi:MAG TPA: hypothetical protein VK629_13325, partial [Steroidobacteraceae bacterium]|nr:hypothetical protein [Steroidobacteraceae bacterium]
MFLRIAIALIAAGVSHAAVAQTSNDPFPPIEATQGALTVTAVEFAKIPDADGGEAPRLMHMVDEAGTKRLFVSTMRGALFAVSYDGKTVTPYLDINAANWSFPVQTNFSERGLQSIAFHPQFAERGAPGFGKFYTYADTTNVTPPADFIPGGTARTHDT